MADDVRSQPDIAFLQIQKHPKLPEPTPINDAPLKTLESKTGIDFGKLVDVDPKKGEEAISIGLASVDDVKFI